MLQVTWWSSAIRPNPATTKVVRPPPGEPDRAYPMANGTASDAPAITGQSRSMVNPDKSAFAPRLGFAWDLTGDGLFASYRSDPFTPFVAREPISEDIDVAVIGAGMCGVLVGAQLREAGVEKIADAMAAAIGSVVATRAQRTGGGVATAHHSAQASRKSAWTPSTSNAARNSGGSSAMYPCARAGSPHQPAIGAGPTAMAAACARGRHSCANQASMTRQVRSRREGERIAEKCSGPAERSSWRKARFRIQCRRRRTATSAAADKHTGWLRHARWTVRRCRA